MNERGMCAAIGAGGDAGEVTGEIKLPYSNDRGMRFVAEADSIRTTGQPKPHLGAMRDTSPVVLDGVDTPEPLQMQHMAFSGGPSPPKLTLEGDNLLILPRHRCALSLHVPVHPVNAELPN